MARKKTAVPAFPAANTSYEHWLGRHVRLIRQDLARKHARMAEDPFAFLRATFFRWAQRWPQVCPELTDAPTCLAVGDLHVENYGTWRDIEGRLVWGVNDFDECWPLPYPNDLVRLATSALLAIKQQELGLKPAEVCEAILQGFGEAVAVGGQPFVLAEGHRALREMAVERLKTPETFWAELESLPRIRREVPTGAAKALRQMLPDRDLEVRYVHRIAGVGSLGRERIVRFACSARWVGRRPTSISVACSRRCCGPISSPAQMAGCPTRPTGCSR